MPERQADGQRWHRLLRGRFRKSRHHTLVFREAQSIKDCLELDEAVGDLVVAEVRQRAGITMGVRMAGWLARHVQMQQIRTMEAPNVAACDDWKDLQTMAGALLSRRDSAACMGWHRCGREDRFGRRRLRQRVDWVGRHEEHGMGRCQSLHPGTDRPPTVQRRPGISAVACQRR